MQDDAPLLHDDLITHTLGDEPARPSNISSHIQFKKGDIDEGFAAADVVIEREFKTATVHQGYIEPHVSVALWNEDGRLKIWTATQGSFVVRQQMSELLKMPVSQITIVPCEIGGGSTNSRSLPC